MTVKSLAAFVLVLVSVGSATAQQQWRKYGFDDVVSVDIIEQPQLIDSLGQSIITSGTEHGVLWVAKIKDDSGPRNESDLAKFYDDFVAGYAKASGVEIISKEDYRIDNLKCLRFKSSPFPNGFVAEGIAVRLDRRAYVFQFVCDGQNTNAVAERDHFFSSIKFLPGLLVQNQLADSRASFMTGLFALLAIAMVPIGGIVFLVYLLIRFVRKKRLTS